jgi:hypothetical protein
MEVNGRLHAPAALPPEKESDSKQQIRLLHNSYTSNCHCLGGVNLPASNTDCSFYENVETVSILSVILGQSTLVIRTPET